jgi:RNA polymerase sigma factor (sigma-70 family)
MRPGQIATLVRAAADGDQDAWDAIVNQFQGLVWSTVRSYRLSDAEAADVVQTAWLRLVENLGTLREPERVGGWLATTASRECLRLLRTAGRSIPVDDEAVFDRAEVDTGSELDAGLLRDERDACLWRAFGRISDRCQRLLRILTADPPPSYDDVSDILDMPVGSIGPTRQRCLDRLRNELAAEGIVTA